MKESLEMHIEDMRESGEPIPQQAKSAKLKWRRNQIIYAKRWMIRAGERGQLIETLRKLRRIGWNAVGDLSEVKSIDEVRQRYSKAYPNDSKAVRQLVQRHFSNFATV